MTCVIEFAREIIRNMFNSSLHYQVKLQHTSLHILMFNFSLIQMVQIWLTDEISNLFNTFSLILMATKIVDFLAIFSLH